MTDEELTELALAADPDAPIPADAITVWDHLGFKAAELLPDWYMPSPLTSPPRKGWRRRLAIVVIAAFLAIDAAGLCSTYGHIVLA